MKKLSITTLIISAVVVSCTTSPLAEKTGLEGKNMPGVNLLLPDSSSYFNTKDIPAGQTAVLFVFSPHCPYCRAQMTDMTQNNNELKGIHIYAMTYSRFKEFKNFCTEFKLSQYANITAGVDYKDSIIRYFKIKGYPFTAIYNPQKKLNKAYYGRLSVEQIKDITGE
jgi:thiol-disulfide isomerase/thioredoxin